MGRKDEFRPRFEGAAVLDELLGIAGARVDANGAIAMLREAHQQGLAPGEAFPALFEGEPRFPDPRIARRLFENLFGAWDAIASGRPLLSESHAPRPKVEKPVAPDSWTSDAGPDDGWVEQAWRYLDSDERARERLWHSFENRQDALLGWLDDQGLTDEGDGVLRLLLSELSAMIELGTGAPLSSADPGSATAPQPSGDAQVPEALWKYAEEALFEAAQDDEAPLTPAELEKVTQLARRGLSALYRARKA